MAKYRVIIGQHVQDGRSYNAGDVIESDVNLSAVFRGKFELVQEPLLTVAAPAPTPEKKQEKEPEPEPEPDADEQDAEGEEAKEEEESEPLEGKDVTASFKIAVDEDFQVIENEQGFWVYDADEPDTVLNKEALKKTQVRSFIRNHLKG